MGTVSMVGQWAMLTMALPRGATRPASRILINEDLLIKTSQNLDSRRKLSHFQAVRVMHENQGPTCSLCSPVLCFWGTCHTEEPNITEFWGKGSNYHVFMGLLWSIKDQMSWYYIITLAYFQYHIQPLMLHQYDILIMYLTYLYSALF